MPAASTSAQFGEAGVSLALPAAAAIACATSSVPSVSASESLAGHEAVLTVDRLELVGEDDLQRASVASSG